MDHPHNSQKGEYYPLMKNILNPNTIHEFQKQLTTQSVINYAKRVKRGSYCELLRDTPLSTSKFNNTLLKMRKKKLQKLFMWFLIILFSSVVSLYNVTEQITCFFFQTT